MIFCSIVFTFIYPLNFISSNSWTWFRKSLNLHHEHFSFQRRSHREKSKSSSKKADAPKSKRRRPSAVLNQKFTEQLVKSSTEKLQLTTKKKKVGKHNRSVSLLSQVNANAVHIAWILKMFHLIIIEKRVKRKRTRSRNFSQTCVDLPGSNFHFKVFSSLLNRNLYSRSTWCFTTFFFLLFHFFFHIIGNCPLNPNITQQVNTILINCVRKVTIQFPNIPYTHTLLKSQIQSLLSSKIFVK